MALDTAYTMQEFTTAVGELVLINAVPDMGFRQFFRVKQVGTKGYKFFVKNGNREVAVDIAVHEKGQVVRRDKSTEKFFFPAYYDKKFDFTGLESYESINGETQNEEAVFTMLVDDTVNGVQYIVESFMRREELNCAQALETGVVTMENGDNLVFPRKAASLVAYNAAHDFGISTVNPEVAISEDIEFLIADGKMPAGGIVNAIFGESVFIDFKNNPFVKEQLDNRRMEFGNLSNGTPVQGLVPHGVYSCGSYSVNVWTYPGLYTDPDTGLETKYMNDKKYILIPMNADFEFVYCAVKAWKGDPKTSMPGTVKTNLYFYEVRDEEAVSMQMGVRSAFMPIIKNVNQVVTRQTKA